MLLGGDCVFVNAPSPTVSAGVLEVICADANSTRTLCTPVPKIFTEKRRQYLDEVARTLWMDALERLFFGFALCIVGLVSGTHEFSTLAVVGNDVSNSFKQRSLGLFFSDAVLVCSKERIF